MQFIYFLKRQKEKIIWAISSTPTFSSNNLSSCILYDFIGLSCHCGGIFGPFSSQCCFSLRFLDIHLCRDLLRPCQLEVWGLEIWLGHSKTMTLIFQALWCTFVMAQKKKGYMLFHMPNAKPHNNQMIYYNFIQENQIIKREGSYFCT